MATPVVVQNVNMSLPPPESFSFVSNEWESWLRRFGRFRIASGLSDKPGNTQVDTLIYVMGSQAETIIENLKLSSADLADYDKVTQALDKYFLPKVNVIFERARFNQRYQLQGETAGDFITDLHKLSEKCNYGALREELVRDRIVVGILDAKLSKNLQMIEKLSLEEAVNRVKNSELVMDQQKTVRHDLNETVDTLNQVSTKRKQFRKQNKNKSSFKGASPNNSGSKNCRRCGNGFHDNPQNCPARNVDCHKCNKKGHFAKWCLGVKPNKNVNSLFFRASDRCCQKRPVAC